MSYHKSHDILQSSSVGISFAHITAQNTNKMMQCKQHSTFCVTSDSHALKCVNPARRNHTSVYKNNNLVCEASHEFSEGCMSTVNKPPQNKKYYIQLEALCRESLFHCKRNSQIRHSKKSLL